MHGIPGGALTDSVHPLHDRERRHCPARRGFWKRLQLRCLLCAAKRRAFFGEIGGRGPRCPRWVRNRFYCVPVCSMLSPDGPKGEEPFLLRAGV